MGVNLVVFVVLARHLGPTDFGLVAATFAYAGLAALLSDFGLPVKMLRDISADPRRGAALLVDGLVVKAAISLLAIIAGVVGLAFASLPLPAEIACATFGMGVMAGSLGDLSMVAYRAVGQFRRETANVLWTSGLYAAVVAVIALLGGGAAWMGVGFLACRSVYAWRAIAGAFAFFPAAPLHITGIRRLLSSMRKSLFWAADSGLGYLNGQLDVLVVPGALGLAQAGLYQAGSRFIVAALALTAVFSNVHIPRLAAARSTYGTARRELLIVAEFTALGLVFGLAFLAGGPIIVQVLLGPKYLAVNELWPGFAAFVFARYAASGVGTLLVGVGRPGLRIAGQVITLAALLFAMALWLPRYGLTAMPWLMAAGSIALLVVYAISRLAVARSGNAPTDPAEDNFEPGGQGSRPDTVH